MKTYLFLAVLVIALAACASPKAGLPLRAQSARGIRVTREATFAFLPEPDMQPQKVAFYSRVRGYLQGRGLKIVAPEEAKFLVQVLIEDEASAFFGDPEKRGISPSSDEDHISVFMFFVLPNGDRKLIEAASKHDLPAIARGNVWRAVTSAPTLMFRQYEEEIITAVFSHLGEDYDGPLGLQNPANPPLVLTPGQRPPATPSQSSGAPQL
jgi:hypothetical protein